MHECIMYVLTYVCIYQSVSVCICVNDTGTIVITSAFFSYCLFT